MTPSLIHTIPQEIRQAIFYYLPIETLSLVTISLVSKAFATSILWSTTFSHQHILFQYKLSGFTDFWEFLNAEGLKEAKWLSLPFTYKVSLYREIMTVPDWKMLQGTTGFELEGVYEENLMKCFRWRMPPDLAFRVVEALLQEEGFDVASQENRLFRWAARSGYTEVVRLLISCPGVDPTDQEQYSITSTPDIENADVVRILLADPRVDPTAHNYLAIRWASDHGHLEVLRLLLDDSRVDPSGAENYCFITSCRMGHLEFVERLLTDSRIDPTSSDNLALRYACELGQTTVVARLLGDSRINPSDPDSSSLALAAENGHVDIVNILLEDGRSDPTAFQQYALSIACEKGYSGIVEALLKDARVDPSVQEHEPLRFACMNGYASIVKMLLEHPKSEWLVAVSQGMRIAILKQHLDVIRVFVHHFEKTAALFGITFLMAIAASTDDDREIIGLFLESAWAQQFLFDALAQCFTQKRPAVFRMILEDARIDSVILTRIVTLLQSRSDAEYARILLEVQGLKVEGLRDSEVVEGLGVLLQK